ncbi:MarR family winged helix-turn-helix transcriptional regulator [Candidatus Nitrosocosmicus agrestis]|uniref:MarR family winged helix-turn-helix transcriptional regulator n=1 Tax=Candidatus Nitrosocosmicus agrestis TaxID=2563600 RepID=UPI00122E7597|nr:MarR family transcriptional regulator [Candidatus Nitrosocosmicus sp. SS]KAA2283576.1 MarR family transcriptional regulator [Candidatus Nitrosocosmicus sp. SS]KAF0869658.1 MarR family transcriptional regulator [Candidatus Nitrosocosmicus sp. SS]
MSENSEKIEFDFENSILFIINKTAKALIHTVDQMLRAKLGITYGQWRVITVLVKNDNENKHENNGMTQKEIASKIGIEDSTIIPIIDKLEKNGLVLRQSDSYDRRNNRIMLTRKSDDVLDVVMNYGEKVKNILLMNISDDELSITKNTLEKMWNNIQSKRHQECHSNTSSKEILGNKSNMEVNTFDEGTYNSLQ